MKAVVAGAGTSGRKISKYLINAGYEVIFIDYNIDTIREVTDNEGLAGIYGQCTSLETMQKVDVGNADIFIAVTSIDEVNLLGCEVASYFGTPRKIAKVSKNNYLTEDWMNNMYGSNRVAVSSIIATNVILAENIVKTLSYNHNYIDRIYDFFDGKAKVISIFCDSNMKIINNTVSSFYSSFFRLNLKLLAINRDGGFIDIDNQKETIIKANDKIYVLIESNQLAEFLENIDSDDKVEKYYDYNYITIIGAHDSIYYLVKKLISDPKTRINVIMNDKTKAQTLAKELQQVSQDHLNIILTENFEQSIKNLYPRYNENFIIMNDNDQENIFFSLYCKFCNLDNIVCILQNSEYESLINYLGINNVYVIDQFMLMPVINEIKGPYENTVKLIKNDIKLVELTIAAKSTFIGKKLSELNINNSGIQAMAALTGEGLAEDIYIKDSNLLLQEGDRVLFAVQYAYVKQADELFNQFLS